MGTNINKKIAVIGGSGFLGKSLLQLLLNENAEIILFTRKKNYQKNLNKIFPRNNIRCIRWNIKNLNIIKNQLPEILDYKINLKNSGSLEAQISSLSDDIAYNCHDIDDGLRAGLFDIKDLLELKYLNKIFKNDSKINKMK